ncbi:flagellar hook-basal body complex protein FliE [Paenibacillus tarimensis]|uniref:flagellar hook-basal body complex protein FliE n=1 Tax=Paenibacillus tarimensis TaxID=416012 RepID=UPI001F423FFA|nr:flagellar hook-basal body complex protein FliE [Paenibacillus tarimensis]MCF2942301.1 flagellar hook-basal body complex protein FliE [Paenibacillus tarimensis]
MITNALVGTAAPLKLTEAGSASKTTPAEAAKSFGSFLQNAINSVAEQEKGVQEITDKFIIGQADVSEVMIVSEQAKLGLQLTAQVRNKAIEAYQEIMRMQI